MESKAQAFDSGEGLLEAITTSGLTREDMCIGMVKASEKEGHVAFAPRSCNEWIDVPAELIGEVEVLRHVPCRDHRHPLIQFRLKIDDSNPVHAMVRKLLSPAASPTPTEMQSPVGDMPTGMPPWSGALSYPAVQQGQQFGALHTQPWGTGGTGFESIGFAPGSQVGQQQLSFGGFTIRCFYYGPFFGRWCCLYFNGRWINCAEMQYNQLSL